MNYMTEIKYRNNVIYLDKIRLIFRYQLTTKILLIHLNKILGYKFQIIFIFFYQIFTFIFFSENELTSNSIQILSYH